MFNANAQNSRRVSSVEITKIFVNKKFLKKRFHLGDEKYDKNDVRYGKIG
jgi:hypothetical protein